MALFRRRTKGVSEVPAGPLCSCGQPLDLVDMSYGFGLPDEVFDLPPDDLPLRVTGLERVFVLDGSRGFVRTLLPVQLDHGSVEFGIWLEVPLSQAQRAVEVWEEPAYSSLGFDGEVANALPPWDALRGARATARPVAQDQLPVVDGGDALVRSLLTGPWPRADVVAALPSLGHEHG